MSQSETRYQDASDEYTLGVVKKEGDEGDSEKGLRRGSERSVEPEESVVGIGEMSSKKVTLTETK